MVMVEGDNETRAEEESDTKTIERMYGVMRIAISRYTHCASRQAHTHSVGFRQSPILDSTRRSTQLAFKRPNPEG